MRLPFVGRRTYAEMCDLFSRQVGQANELRQNLVAVTLDRDALKEQLERVRKERRRKPRGVMVTTAAGSIDHYPDGDQVERLGGDPGKAWLTIYGLNPVVDWIATYAPGTFARVEVGSPEQVTEEKPEPPSKAEA